MTKSQYLKTSNVCFGNTNVNLISEGMRHLGAVIGSYLYEEKYVSKLVTCVNNQLQFLPKIAETESQSVYKAFISGCKSKLTNFICKIPDISE